MFTDEFSIHTISTQHILNGEVLKRLEKKLVRISILLRKKDGIPSPHEE